MKKKTILLIITLCLAAALTPAVSHAAVTAHFMAVNDTLLPFNDSTMPLVSGGVIYIPYETLLSAGVWSMTTLDLSWVRLYRDARYVDIFADRGTTEDNHGIILGWPPSRRIGSAVYVPLHQVSAYFDLTYTLIEVGGDIIPDVQIWVVRVMSDTALSSRDFVVQHGNAMRAAYNEYFALQPSPPPTAPPGVETPAQPPEEVPPPPSYSDVTVYLSFYDISAGGAGQILDLFDAWAAFGYSSCFFLSANDIADNPALIRRIYGSGHTVGIWLDDGSFDEYLEASALLFEAAKTRTVLVSSDEEAAGSAIEAAHAHGLIYWGASRSYGGSFTVSEVTAALPTESGQGWKLRFSCSEDTAAALPGVLSFLRTFDYSAVRITETVVPFVE